MHRHPDQAQHGNAPLAVPAQADAAAQPWFSPSAEVTVPVSLLAAAQERVAPESAAPEPAASQPDGKVARLREYLDEVRQRAAGATSWLETSEHYERLLNSEGFVPVTARFDAKDLRFLGQARPDLLGFAELGLRLADLHRPLDAGGTTSNPANPALRCRNCMWRWPCPTVRLMTEILAEQPTGPR
jgi:hypothetical protein